MEDVLSSAFRRHYRQIYGYVRRSGSSHADAEDIAQDVFANAAADLERLTNDSRPVTAWLYTVARRRLIDHARRKTRAGRAAGLPARAEVELEYGPSIAKALREALGKLPEQQRRVVILKLLEGRPFAEIADRLDITEAASRMRFSRGLERLREELEREGIRP